MPYLTSTPSKGTAFSRKNRSDSSNGVNQQPPRYGIKGADQGPSFHIRPAGDAYEQQADRIAEKITHQLQAGTPVKRSSEGVKPLKEGVSNQKGESVSEKTASEIAETQGKGQPLPPAIRKPAEKALGKSLADVRLHTGAKASALNREVGAEAFAVKKDIFVGNQLDLSRPEGREVALHEAVHTQQQSQSTGVGAIQRHYDTLPLKPRPAYNTGTPPWGGSPVGGQGQRMEEATRSYGRGVATEAAAVAQRRIGQANIANITAPPAPQPPPPAAIGQQNDAVIYGTLPD